MFFLYESASPATPTDNTPFGQERLSEDAAAEATEKSAKDREEEESGSATEKERNNLLFYQSQEEEEEEEDGDKSDGEDRDGGVLAQDPIMEERLASGADAPKEK